MVLGRRRFVVVQQWRLTIGLSPTDMERVREILSAMPLRMGWGSVGGPRGELTVFRLRVRARTSAEARTQVTDEVHGAFQGLGLSRPSLAHSSETWRNQMPDGRAVSRRRLRRGVPGRWPPEGGADGGAGVREPRGPAPNSPPPQRLAIDPREE